MEENKEQAKVDTIAIDNPGKSPIYVNGKAIMPDETRVFKAADVPPYLRPEQQEQADDDNGAGSEGSKENNTLAELLEGAIPTIVEALPGLKDDDLQALAGLEQAGKDRKGVLEAIAAEQLKRAAG